MLSVMQLRVSLSASTLRQPHREHASGPGPPASPLSTSSVCFSGVRRALVVFRALPQSFAEQLSCVGTSARRITSLKRPREAILMS